MSKSRKILWIVWAVGSLLLAGFLFMSIRSTDSAGAVNAAVFLPNDTTSGHHQIELVCTTCHVEPFGGPELVQQACVECHQKEFDRVDDSHPKKKFTDPRNVDTLTNIDARFCVSCHVEHKPDMTEAMGVTQPDDVCFHCHQDVGETRPTHKDLEFTTCATSGCHNFHDNKALYEDFLVRHMDDADQLEKQILETKDLITASYMNVDYPGDTYPIAPLTIDQADAPEEYASEQGIHDDWLASKHSTAGVNCTACHAQKTGESNVAKWIDKPNHESCEQCHTEENNSFQEGKHGMRIKAELSPMTPAMARLEMNPENMHETLTCNSCHAAHTYDTAFAATQGCQQCHADEHTLNYEQSAHAQLWIDEASGNAPENSGVSCSTCHVPRIWHEDDVGNERILVDHNQNNTLRPNDKMLSLIHI